MSPEHNISRMVSPTKYQTDTLGFVVDNRGRWLRLCSHDGTVRTFWALNELDAQAYVTALTGEEYGTNVPVTPEIAERCAPPETTANYTLARRWEAERDAEMLSLVSL